MESANVMNNLEAVMQTMKNTCPIRPFPILLDPMSFLLETNLCPNPVSLATHVADESTAKLFVTRLARALAHFLLLHDNCKTMADFLELFYLPGILFNFAKGPLCLNIDMQLLVVTDKARPKV